MVEICWKSRLAQEIEHQHSLSTATLAASPTGTQPVQFAAVLTGLLVDLLLGVLKQCLLQHVLAQHRAVNRRPDGRVAHLMRAKFEESFLKKHPEHDPAAVKAHVDSSIEAFREAGESELIDLYRDQQSKPVDPDDDDWDHAAVAASLGGQVFAAQDD